MSTPTWEEETIVGFEEEAMILKEQLTGGPKQLEVVSIVGMAGIGKTTLASKVYNDPLVSYHFYIRAWITVSQEYIKRDLLHALLSSVLHHANGVDQMSLEELAQHLYKCLKGKRYLVVMDDIWDTMAWFDLKNCLPNDNNGSRVVLTSRHIDAVKHAKPSRPPLSLRFLTHDESWDLFQQKVFRRETCPPELVEIGFQLSKRCHGLPLAIVVVAGILANEKKTQDRWKKVEKNLISQMAADPEVWMKTLALSYNHLPYHLKPCFLYFAAFPEDYQIPVQKLICLWIAEGFIRKSLDKSLEEVAGEYLIDLITRSLVLVSKRGYDGEIKACGMHDLLRDYCFTKAEEEHFLQHISGNQHVSSSSSKNFNHMSRVCMDSIRSWTTITALAKNIRSVFSLYHRYAHEIFLSPSFKCLWVLDITRVEMSYFPIEIMQLVLLRYLALSLFYSPEIYLPASISNLLNLETLILHTVASITLPRCITKMVKLRHLILPGEGIHSIGGLEPRAHYPFLLNNLQTFSWVDPNSCKNILSSTPNLRKLGFWGHMVHGGSVQFPDLDFLNHLQELKLFGTLTKAFGLGSYDLGRVKFPPNLKKLTLRNTFLKWAEMPTLGKLLPNLEVLKLLRDACIGPRWETGDGEFPKLKFLKLDSVYIVQWEASSDHFPRLQRLALIKCDEIEKIPSEIGYISTLQMIEVHCCNCSLANSVREIKEEQSHDGNFSLKIIIGS